MAKESLVAIEVPDEAYASGWNGKTEVPTKNAVHDMNERYLIFPLIDKDTDVTVQSSIGGDWVIPFNCTILQSDTAKHKLAARTDTAGTGGTMVVDIHKGGTSIMTTNKLDIETTEKSSADAATQPDLTTTSYTAGDIITFDIDAIHSTTAAKGLKVYMAVRPT